MEKLSTLEKEQNVIDNQIRDYSVKLLRPFYENRRPILKNINRFWATVICETEPLRPYILFEDSLVFDELIDLYIEYDKDDSRNFTLTMEFNDNPHFEAQTLTKKFIWHEPLEKNDAEKENRDTEKGKKDESDDEDDGYYISPSPTAIKWKSEKNLGSAHKHGGEESFFTLFEYTDTDVKEDRDENTTIIQLLTDEIFPNAIPLFKSAQDDQDIAEEYDISDL